MAGESVHVVMIVNPPQPRASAESTTRLNTEGRWCLNMWDVSISYHDIVS